ncbi:MAG: phage holin family protein [Actinobacteria bacterium]|nr:MAG: phage holin family protein [Actinomycetota bacterium]TMM09963.1 MAG: phage holin family protein [Actinomycetota bacterium]
MPFALRLLAAWAVDAAALAVAAWIFSGVSVGGSTGTLILAALVYGLLASFVKPVLKLMTFPLAILTLGVAWFFVAMFVIWLTDAIVGGFRVDGFWTLVGATVVVWAVGAAADHWLFPRKRGLKRVVAASSRFGRV